MFFLILVIVGFVTIFGILIIGAIETRRVQKGQPDIISSILKKGAGKAQKKS